MELSLASPVVTFLNGRITLQLTIISACQKKNVKLLLSLEAFAIIADFRSACHVECQKMVSKFVQYTLDLRKLLGVAKKFLKSRSFLFQTLQNP